MSLLRKTIRRMLLESNQQYYEKLASLFNGGVEDIMQAMSLGEGIGVIREIETNIDDESRIAYYQFRFKCLEEDFGPFLQQYKNQHGPHPAARWQFARRRTTVTIMLVEDRGVNWVNK